jgi:hypothetical protein
MPLRLNVSGLFPVAEPVFKVRLPGWDDVIHWAPKLARDPADYARDLARMRAELAASPTPDVVRDFAKIGQEIDNVQDALVTLSVLGRVAVATTGRMIPGLGWIATAADVLNMLNLFYPPGVIGGKRWRARREAKRRMSLASSLTGGTYKQRLLETFKTGKVGLGVGEVLQILQTTDQYFGVGLSLGPIFGASSDALFGLARGVEFEVPGYAEVFMSQRGAAALFRVNEFLGMNVENVLSPGVVLYISLMLGALGVGAAGFRDADFANERLKLSWPGVIPFLDIVAGLPQGETEQQIARGLAPFVGPAKAGVAAVLWSFGNVQDFLFTAAVTFGRAAAYLGGYRDDLPVDVHVDLAMGQSLLLGLVTPGMQSSEWGELARPFTLKPWWGGPLPLVPGAESMTVGDVSVALREGGAAAPLKWLEQVPSGAERDFMNGLVTTYVSDMFQAMEGPGARVSADSGPLWRAALTLQERDLVWPGERTDAEGRRYLEAVAGLDQGTGEGFASAAAVLREFAAVWPGVFDGW